jgi:exosortase A-associated hydrolase 1
MNINEQAIIFPCAGEHLLGIVSCPEQTGNIGVLIIVGGPQYRAGSHRQFLLIARVLAAAGYHAMRFDYRGMGDSTGVQRDFEAVGSDIAAAVDAFMVACPGLERIVLWGLCDAASASLLYVHAYKDERLKGLVLLNPWVRSEVSLARTHIKHYYAQRLLQREFWRKLVRGRLGLGRALGDLLGSLNRARQAATPTNREQSFQEKMCCALAESKLPALLILSGGDYTAKEFIEATKIDSKWQEVLTQQRVTTHQVADADHTFSSKEWRHEVEVATISWLQKLTKH